jgi:hypothetical protein
MPAPIDKSKCQAPDMKGEGLCGREVIAIIKPSGRREIMRYSCDFHLSYWMNYLRELTGINRIVVQFMKGGTWFETGDSGMRHTESLAS